ncbi:MAG: hypothetical protein FWG83_08120 [Oscillospiraceae bacterium]|nr:hypothetical protein [Oscillospiraceae bacterium]
MKNRQKKSAQWQNFFILAALIAGLSAYFTIESLWNVGTVVVILLLGLMATFYFWLWRSFK